jgi:hypothetical protein
VTAAVLLYRAVTYLAPIPLGAIACLAWRHAPALTHHTGANPETMSRALTMTATRSTTPESATLR